MCSSIRTSTDDWLMRATGDSAAATSRCGRRDPRPGSRRHRHATVGCAYDGRAGAVLLRDVSAGLLPPGDGLIAIESHRRFLDHMAALHAAFWGWRDEIGLTPLAEPLPGDGRPRSPPPRPRSDRPRRSRRCWRWGGRGCRRWRRRWRRSSCRCSTIRPPCSPRWGQVPHTFVHGDWKAGNLGEHPDGRTILIDWGEFPGEASPLADLTWYLALNAARLPESKDDTIATYRRALEGHGVATAGWWDDAVALELLATMVQFGWEKALAGPGPELDWWESAALRGATYL